MYLHPWGTHLHKRAGVLNTKTVSIFASLDDLAPSSNANPNTLSLTILGKFSILNKYLVSWSERVTL